ncbi:MAG: hypothetical protein IH626_12890, partial [Rhodospirillales bacterium]|nr:hypothetical protein [Rhodospirillales bacterium]
HVEADAAGGATPEEQRALLKAERNRLKSQLHGVEESLREIGRGAADESDT